MKCLHRGRDILRNGCDMRWLHGGKKWSANRNCFRFMCGGWIIQIGTDKEGIFQEYISKRKKGSKCENNVYDLRRARMFSILSGGLCRGSISRITGRVCGEKSVREWLPEERDVDRGEKGRIFHLINLTAGKYSLMLSYITTVSLRVDKIAVCVKIA